MSSTFLCILLILLLSSLFNSAAARNFPPGGGVTITTTPLVLESQEYDTVKPQLDHQRQQVFRGREVKSCLPKGFRHGSAPSRFVNYHVLHSGGCSSTMHTRKP